MTRLYNDIDWLRDNTVWESMPTSKKVYTTTTTTGCKDCKKEKEKIKELKEINSLLCDIIDGLLAYKELKERGLF